MAAPVYLLWSGSCTYDTRATRNPPDKQRVLDAYQHRYRALADRGVNLRVIMPARDFWKGLRIALADRLEEALPGLLVPLRHQDDEGLSGAMRYLYAIKWPRDIVQMVRETVYTPQPEYSRTQGILKTLGLSSRLRASLLGEGGLHVGNDSFRIIGDHASLTRAYRILDEERMEVYRMPLCFSLGKRRSPATRLLQERTKYNGHMDTEVNVAFSPDGNTLLVVSNHYHRLFSEKVAALTRTLDACLYVPTPRETALHAVNFCTLPDKSVLIPDTCRGTISFLEKNLGRNKVVPLTMLPRECTLQGGLRCCTALLS